ncbi:hypothetical protein BZA77DRAFT_169356 [Pyronema omphalodes]|nr:hypothetical protein BZA77DRAFT_169356 [Pyronema omphalodes]
MPTITHITKESIRWLTLLFCCPCVFLLLLCGCGSSCKCGQHRPRKLSTHAAIIVARAPPPAYVDLPASDDGDAAWDPIRAHVDNGGNRVFWLRPDDGVLASGNIAGGCPRFKVVKTPELVGVIGADKWKWMLSKFKETRDQVVPKVVKKKKGKGINKLELKWVEEAVRVVKEGIEGEKTEQKMDEKKPEIMEEQKEKEKGLEVWKVTVEAEGGLVHEELNMDFGGVAETIDEKYLWTTRTFTRLHHHRLWMMDRVDPKQVEDRLTGRWAKDYLEGNGEPLTVPTLPEHLNRLRPRTSADSGILERIPEDDAL